jgi:hypothetical protein
VNLYSLPACPDPLPEDIDKQVKILASIWAKHSLRPRLDAAVARHWDELIDAWSADSSLPLLIRKQEKGIARGEPIQHEFGRELVLTDNSPASWSYMLAYGKSTPSLTDIRNQLERDEIPVAMVTDGGMIERSRYKCNRIRSNDRKAQLWKVCHRHKVALEGRGSVTQRPIAHLQAHFRRFLAPSNIFLVPLELGGLGELPHFIEAIGDDL